MNVVPGARALTVVRVLALALSSVCVVFALGVGGVACSSGTEPLSPPPQEAGTSVPPTTDASSPSANDAADAADAAVALPAPDSCAASKITAPPTTLELAAFYTRYLDASGIPIVSSNAPDVAALARACVIVKKLVEHRDDVRLQMVAHAARVAVMGKNQVTTDIPEHADLNTAFPGTDWNTRARGLGGTVARPATSCAEENVLCLAGDAYVGENILVHEFAHGMLGLGIVFADKTFRSRLESAYASAMAAGLWKDTYAATNYDEYWAEGVQDWFDANLEANPANGIHGAIDTRAELENYDPSLYTLVREIYGDAVWKPGCP